MAYERAEKVIPPHSKFTSELDMSIPEDRKEMNNRVFGRGYKTDRNGNIVDQSRGSDAWLISDRFEQETEREQQILVAKQRDFFVHHISAIREHGPGGICPMAERGTHLEAAAKEVGRINSLRRKAGLEPWPAPPFMKSFLGAGTEAGASAPKSAADEI